VVVQSIGCGRTVWLWVVAPLPADAPAQGRGLTAAAARVGEPMGLASTCASLEGASARCLCGPQPTSGRRVQQTPGF